MHILRCDAATASAPHTQWERERKTHRYFCYKLANPPWALFLSICCNCLRLCVEQIECCKCYCLYIFVHDNNDLDRPNRERRRLMFQIKREDIEYEKPVCMVLEWMINTGKY